MATPKLIADEALMRQLLRGMGFPKGGFRIKLPTEEMAKMLFTCYISAVTERGRQFVNSDKLQEEVWKVAEALTLPTYRFGILLSGGCGNGKTTMLHALRTTIHLVYEQNISAFVEHPRFRTSIPIVSAKDMIQEIILDGKTYESCDILMIDDLGHEPTEVIRYGMVLTPIVDLIERRYARQRYTIISTNLNASQIRPKYKNRIADRFNEMFHFIEFEEDSYRI